MSQLDNSTNMSMMQSQEQPTVSIREVEQYKELGNQAFSANSYIKAIRLYEEGLRKA
jgi:hypothetical protein